MHWEWRLWRLRWTHLQSDENSLKSCWNWWWSRPHFWVWNTSNTVPFRSIQQGLWCMMDLLKFWFWQLAKTTVTTFFPGSYSMAYTLTNILLSLSCYHYIVDNKSNSMEDFNFCKNFRRILHLQNVFGRWSKSMWQLWPFSALEGHHDVWLPNWPKWYSSSQWWAWRWQCQQDRH